MIIIRYSGGLGNQMFQYAFQVMLADKFPDCKIKADLNHFNLYKVHRGFELNELFDIDIDKAKRREIRKLSNTFMLPVCTRPVSEKIIFGLELMYKKMHRKKRTQIKQRAFNSYDSDIFNYINANEAVYLEGEWQNWKYYSGMEGLLRTVFKFKNNFIKYNHDLVAKIQNSNSVSIHIRRGDFSNNPAHDICGQSYYLQCINIINKELSNPVFYVFSDDIRYSKELLRDINAVFVSGGDDREDMQLMSMCRHHIIANSSYSFWAAFLGSGNDDRIILAPKYFLRDDNKWFDFETPSDWRKVDNKTNE